MPSTCFITPTYAGDLARFALLRRTIGAFAPSFPHLVIVNTEDFPVFSDRFGRDPGVEIIRSADVLPARLEFRRRRSGPRWITALRRVPGGLIKGWHAQQLMKLHVLAECAHAEAVFIDSDVLVCRPVTADFFRVNDRLKLYRRIAPNAECMDFDIAANEVLGNCLEKTAILYDYIYSPSCFRAATGARLFREFRRRRRSWERRFLAQRRASEYHLLGYIASAVEQFEGYELTECDPEDVHHSIRYRHDLGRLPTVLGALQSSTKPFALLQSRLRLDIHPVEVAVDALLSQSIVRADPYRTEVRASSG